jgi:hypothetical protein
MSSKSTQLQRIFVTDGSSMYQLLQIELKAELMGYKCWEQHLVHAKWNDCTTMTRSLQLVCSPGNVISSESTFGVMCIL